MLMMAVQLLCGAAVFPLHYPVTVLRMLMGTRMPRFCLFVAAVLSMRPVVCAQPAPAALRCGYGDAVKRQRLEY